MQYSIHHNAKYNQFVAKIKMDSKWNTKIIPRGIKDINEAKVWINEHINTFFPPPQFGLIYFYQLDNLDKFIKIGYSLNATTLRQRLASIQTDNPYNLSHLATIAGYKSDEQMLHASFAEYHVRGEWFQPAKIILSLINEIQQSERLKQCLI